MEMRSVVHRGASVGALTDFGGVGRGGRVRCAECLASAPVDKALRLLAGAACSTSVTVCEDCLVMPGVVGTLSPSDSDCVGPVGPDGTLSSSVFDVLIPAIHAGLPFPAGPLGMLSQSDF